MPVRARGGARSRVRPQGALDRNLVVLGGQVLLPGEVGLQDAGSASSAILEGSLMAAGQESGAWAQRKEAEAGEAGVTGGYL